MAYPVDLVRRAATETDVDGEQRRLSQLRRSDEPRRYVLDVLVDGKPVRRDVVVEVAGPSLRLGDEVLPLDSIFWVSRRAGLALLFSRERTIALLGKTGDLEELARSVERGSDRAAQRHLLQPLAREVVVCTAGTAVSGRANGRRISGLHLAVFTQHGLHLIARDQRTSLSWPVVRAEGLEVHSGEPGRGGLLLENEESSITLRYLFPEEVQAVKRVATSEPKRLNATAGSLELFARGEVAPPPRPSLPEFTVSVETVQKACAEAATRVAGKTTVEAVPGPAFFERHFRELGERALGPLVVRRSAAVAATTLERAVEALDAEQLREETRSVSEGVARWVFHAYRQELERLLDQRRPARELDTLFRDDGRVKAELARRAGTQCERLEARFSRLLARQHLLLQRLHALKHGPPEAEDIEVEEAADQWRDQVTQLDRTYGEVWRETIEMIAEVWSETLVPRLSRVALLPVQRWSESAKLTGIAVATFVLVAMTVWIVF